MILINAYGTITYKHTLLLLILWDISHEENQKGNSADKKKHDTQWKKPKPLVKSLHKSFKTFYHCLLISSSAI